ncbi:MAG: prenyltransferase/squalene oxidase repeat-containing protein [Rhodopirellula sp. JB044]|uniref:prenyltransferase/squalene oxidase repeat-containing protein n=1 Tax=Rhodopirellula sp. JB044 TaxID=3342844 RepID=UPI00370B265F
MPSQTALPDETAIADTVHSDNQSLAAGSSDPVNRERVIRDQAFRDQVRRTLDDLRDQLLAERAGRSHWIGELSASALSTATAISALSVACEQLKDGEQRERYLDLIRRGVIWLQTQQNEDGGFGDTNRSHSNIATSYLVLAACTLARRVDAMWTPEQGNLLENTNAESGSDASTKDQRLRRYLDDAGGLDALRKRYGKDKTFVVPILNNLAIAGLVPWSEVAALPFEAAVFPQSMYRYLGMPVVSYAVPALVAIGQAKFYRSGCLPPLSWIRQASINPTLALLERMQPDSGGYLEATPLTSFVVMSLVDSLAAQSLQLNPRLDQRSGADDCRCRVIETGLNFIEQSITPEGSWPIDTNLATWVTSLSIAALTSDPNDLREWSGLELVDWLLSCQHTERHPFTGADPGGWGWTDLSGAVPDADDTPGAILALLKLRNYVDEEQRGRIDQAISNGRDWLLGLQNRDGGWPTFCRGWGKLPFDRSSVDLTAHAIRALDDLSDSPKVDAAITVGLAFLRKQQRPDGSWVPLWFGNQDRVEEDNPIYGTAKVLIDVHPRLDKSAVVRGIEYLINHQNADGGWGGGESVERFWNTPDPSSSFNDPAARQIAGSGVASPQRSMDPSSNSGTDATQAPDPTAKPSHEFGISTVEETALAVEALASLWDRLNTVGVAGIPDPDADRDGPRLTDRTRDAILSGSRWLMRAARGGRLDVAWPIGFYFAKLWYHERLYPLIFTTAALGRVAGLDDTLSRPDTTLPR